MENVKLIKDSEAYNTFFKYSSGLIILVSKKAIMLDVNDNLLELFNYKREEIINKSITKLIDLSYMPTILKKLPKTLRGEEIVGGTEVRIKTKNGDYKYLKTSGKSLRVYDEKEKLIGILPVLIDNTLSRVNEEKYKMLYENMHSGCVVYEQINDCENFIIRDLNNAAERIDSIKKEKVIGGNVTEVFPGIKEFGLLDIFKKVYKTGKAELFPVANYKDDRIQGWRENYVYKLPTGEIVAIYSDKTKEKETEQKLIKQNEEYSKLNKEYLNQNTTLKNLSEELADSITFLESNKRQLERAQEIAILGHYVLDIKTGCWSSSTVLNTIFGIDENHKKNIKSWFSIIHPDFRNEMHTYIEENALGGNEQFDKEYKIVNQKTKEEKWVHGIGELLFNDKKELVSMYGTIQDVTKRKKVEEALKESERQFRILFEESHDAIFVVDIATWHFLDANKAAEKLTGRTLEELKKLSPDDVSPVDIDQRKNKAKKAKKTTGLGEVTYIRPDGSERLVMLSVIPLRENVNYGIAHDITELKEVENKLRQQNEENIRLNKEYLSKNEQLEKAIKRAEESDELKTAFLANMSHEIRTPMNGIIGFSRLLNTKKLPEEKVKQYLTLINRNSQQLLGIINDLVDISKIETGQLEAFEVESSVNNILSDLFLIYDPILKDKNIKFIIHKPLSDENSLIYTDHIKLRQIIENFISNSLKFTQEGYIEVGYNLKNDNLEFYVTDTGIGVKKELQETIFERFRQGDEGITREFGGTGLGLSIAKSFIKLLGGDIKLESEFGKGSTFSFTIPYNLVKKDKAKDNEEFLVSEIKKNQKILVIEDDQVNFLYLEELLIEIEAEIIHAKNGVDAIKLFKDNPKIDIVLLDIKLPDMSGYDVLKEIRDISPDIPVIAQTAYTMSGDENNALSHGCNDYLSKPIDREDFFRKINKY